MIQAHTSLKPRWKKLPQEFFLRMVACARIVRRRGRTHARVHVARAGVPHVRRGGHAASVVGDHQWPRGDTNGVHTLLGEPPLLVAHAALVVHHRAVGVVVLLAGCGLRLGLALHHHSFLALTAGELVSVVGVEVEHLLPHHGVAVRLGGLQAQSVDPALLQKPVDEAK